MLMSRSIWKPPYVNKQVLDNLGSKNFIVQNRATLILPSIINHTFKIYNGIRTFTRVVGSDQIGQTLGQFAPTRKRPINKKQLKVVKKKTQTKK